MQNCERLALQPLCVFCMPLLQTLDMQKANQWFAQGTFTKLQRNCSKHGDVKSQKVVTHEACIRIGLERIDNHKHQSKHMLLTNVKWLEIDNSSLCKG